jgi:two-component system, cell cycle response regulator
VVVVAKAIAQKGSLQSRRFDSGVRPKTFAPDEPPSGIRLSRDEVVPRIYEEDETEVSVTATIVEAAKRAATQPRLVVIEGTCMGDVLSLDPARELVVGRSSAADIRFDDTSISRRHCRIAPSNDGFIIEDLGSANGTFVNGKRLPPGPRRLRSRDRIQIGEHCVVQYKLLDGVEDTLARRLYVAAVRDALTQAYNRRHFDQRLASEASFATRHGTPLSVLMLDIDLFKAVNDTYGHGAGDAVLVAVASTISTCVRAEDIVARYGGEEFALIIRSDADAATLLAERIRSKIEALEVTYAGQTLRVTASVGVADCKSVADSSTLAENLVARADRRLYRAKHLGRNRVCNVD